MVISLEIWVFKLHELTCWSWYGISKQVIRQLTCVHLAALLGARGMGMSFAFFVSFASFSVWREVDVGSVHLGRFIVVKRSSVDFSRADSPIAFPWRQAEALGLRFLRRRLSSASVYVFWCYANEYGWENIVRYSGSVSQWWLTLAYLTFRQLRAPSSKLYHRCQ